MEITERKLLTIVAESVLEPRLIEVVDKMGAVGYTITDARGSGSRGARSAGWTHNGNIRFEVICTGEIADRIAAHLREHYYANYAMVLFITDVGVMRPDKF
ncbi:MAG: transcriptional regulator [Pseudomonadota bacterium]